MGPLQVQEVTMKVLIAYYKHGPAAIVAVKGIRDYAEASLTLSAFAESTNIILEEDPAQAPPGLCPPRDDFTQVPQTPLPPSPTRIGQIRYKPPPHQNGPLPRSPRRTSLLPTLSLPMDRQDTTPSRHYS